MTKYLIAIIFATGLLIQISCLQKNNKTKSCYSDKLPGKEKMVTKMVNNPYFKGGHDSLVRFLSDNIDFEKFVSDPFRNRSIFSDTARINFIVNEHGGMSNLSVKMTKTKEFAEELTRVIKKSSCNWVAGETEGAVTGWHQFDIYFSIDKTSDNEVRTIMTINEL